MPIPKSVVKVSSKGNITFVSNVDRCQYTIKELSRAALKDVAKYIRKLIILEMKKLPGMKKHIRPYRAVSYWVRKKESDLQIGFGHTKKNRSGDTWYAIQQELGTDGQPKRGIMRDVVYKNIPTIIEIQSKYISALESESKSLSMIDESEGAEDNE